MSFLEFKNPLFLFLLVPWGAMLFWYIYRKLWSAGSAFAVSSRDVVTVRMSLRARTYHYLPVLRFLSVLLLIIALSRPGRGVDYSSVKNLGIDIMIALDASGSMMGEDFEPENRLAVARKVMADFIEKRKSDRIGMVVFAGEAYLQCPLTVEHDMLADIIEEIDFDTVSVDGTAIGEAIALSASRMMDSTSKSRIILLITDGMNNRGSIDPETAAQTCAEMGVKIYSVGIGRDGRVPYPNPGGLFSTKRYLLNHFDPTVLRHITEITGGRFYRAESSGVLWQNIKDIDMLEKSEVDLKLYHEFYDRFNIFLMIAAGLFFLEIMLRSLIYRKIP